MINKKKSEYAFSFVELIIVVTIISILVAVWYISYNSYISKSRDSSRISQISTIYWWLETAKQIWKIPLPENKVSIYASWSLIWYQWYVWDYVLKQIGYDEEWKDPLDNSNYTYAINSKLRKIQLLTFLENNPTNEDNLWDIKSNLGQEKFERIPKTYWDKLWIILEQNFNPIQNNNLLVTSWIDVETTSSWFIVVFSNSENIYWTWNLLKTLYWTYTTWIVWNNCQDYVYENKWYALKDWDYLINSWSLYKQYCNTSSWVTQYASCIWNLPANSMPTYWNQFLQTYDWEKWIPETLSWWYNNENIWCDFNCEIWFVWNWTICQWWNWVCWSANWLVFNYKPTWIELCQMWSPLNLTWSNSWPWTWTCQWAGGWSNASCYTIQHWKCWLSHTQDLRTNPSYLCLSWKPYDLTWTEPWIWTWKCNWIWTWSTSEACFTVANGACWEASRTLYIPPSTPNVTLLCERWTSTSPTDLWNNWTWSCNWIWTWSSSASCKSIEINFCSVKWIWVWCFIH